MKIRCRNQIRVWVVIAAALITSGLSAQTALIEQGRTAIQRGDHDAAISTMEKAVAQHPDNAEAHFGLSLAYGSKAQKGGLLAMANYGSKAKGACERAVALDPNHLEARFGLVQFYAQAPAAMGGSQAKAFKQAEEIKALDRVMGHRAYASIYAHQKKLDLARKEYAEAIREQPSSAIAHTYFGQHLANVEKNYPAACAEFETALKLDPRHMPALYHLGRAASSGAVNLSRGEEALKKYLAYQPKPNEPPLASAHYHLGAIYEKTTRRAEAQQSYQATLKSNPTHKQATDALKRLSHP